MVGMKLAPDDELVHLDFEGPGKGICKRQHQNKSI